jgi:hypothetical protein
MHVRRPSVAKMATPDDHYTSACQRMQAAASRQAPSDCERDERIERFPPSFAASVCRQKPRPRPHQPCIPHLSSARLPYVQARQVEGRSTGDHDVLVFGWASGDIAFLEHNILDERGTRIGSVTE